MAEFKFETKEGDKTKITTININPEELATTACKCVKILFPDKLNEFKEKFWKVDSVEETQEKS